MNTPQLIADLLVAVIVLACVWRAIRELTPSLHRQILTMARRAAGMPLAPSITATAGCNAGCGPCKGCGNSEPAQQSAEQPLKFQPRKR